MKFAIRDDDLNYFFDAKNIEDNLKEIWDICPVSMSAIPFVKGNWLKNTQLLESLGTKNISKDIISKIKADKQIYEISKNIKLVDFINKKIKEGKLYITIHAIHHRNEDDILPNLSNNFPIGAEFYTNRDLTFKLRDAIKYLEETFHQKIFIFTPPQNVLSIKGYESVRKNNLNICAYLPPAKFFWKNIYIIGFKNYLKYFKFKLLARGYGAPYPFVLHYNGLKFVEHKSLQPGTSICDLYRDFDLIHKMGGDFVLSTHSYAFNQRMHNSDKTMGQILREFLLYVENKKDVKFVSLDRLLEINK